MSTINDVLPHELVSIILTNIHPAISRRVCKHWSKLQLQPCHDGDVWSYAAAIGSINLLEWLETQGPAPKKYERVCECAAINNRINVLQWLQKRQYVPVWIIDVAAQHGNLDAVIWIHNNVGKGSRGSLNTSAAYGGHIHVLEWVYDNYDGVRGTHHVGDAKWNAEHSYLIVGGLLACSAAALGGHLETLQWLRAKGFEWSEFTIHGTLVGGHIHIAQWCYDNGHEWKTSRDDPDMYSPEVREWLLLHPLKG